MKNPFSLFKSKIRVAEND